MKTLSYTAEKDNSIVSVSNRLMVSEYQINDLLDSLVSNGYTILTTEIGDGDDSPHWQGQTLSVLHDKISPITKQKERIGNKMKIEIAVWNSKKTKVLMVDTFNSTKEILDFMKELQVVEKDASYNVTAVRKDK